MPMSSRLKTRSMQKQPSRPYRIVHAPIALPEDFPVLGGDFFEQGDAPITWLHRHDCLELGYCLDGAGVFIVGDKVLPFRSGDISVITPEEVHLAQSVPGTKSRWAWIYLDPFRLLRLVGRDNASLALEGLAGRRFCNLISPERDPLLGTLVQELVAELRAGGRHSSVAVRGLVAVVMARLQRLSASRRGTMLPGLEAAMRRVSPALDLMAEHYAEKPDVRRWARQCHVSVTHFRRLFRQALGKAPHAYLTELRVLMAGSRLQSSDEKVIRIADEAGFPALSSFNRAFRRVMKMTPREWRARGLGSQSLLA